MDFSAFRLQRNELKNNDDVWVASDFTPATPETIRRALEGIDLKDLLKLNAPSEYPKTIDIEKLFTSLEEYGVSENLKRFKSEAYINIHSPNSRWYGYHQLKLKLRIKDLPVTESLKSDSYMQLENTDTVDVRVSLFVKGDNFGIFRPERKFLIKADFLDELGVRHKVLLVINTLPDFTREDSKVRPIELLPRSSQPYGIAETKIKFPTFPQEWLEVILNKVQKKID